MEVITRIVKGESIIIGSFEMIDRGEWIWTCFDKSKGEMEEIFSQGCATSRRDAESEVRREYRNQ